jgi:hypothetical protein
MRNITNRGQEIKETGDRRYKQSGDRRYKQEGT